MTNTQPDRVSFSFGMKLQTEVKYESADFHVSLTSDVKSNETPEQAFNRVKAEVEKYATQVYSQIRNSEYGITGSNEGHQDTKSVDEQNTKGSSDGAKQQESLPQASPNKPRDINVLKKQIKHAYGVLEAQKKVSRTDFVKNFLKGKKTDDLNELEVTRVIVELREQYPELGL